MGKIIVIVSGKGGVGKSTVAASVSVCLSDAGASVLLIDADAEMRNLDIMLGVSDRILWDISDATENRCGFADAVLEIPGHPGLSFIPGAADRDQNSEFGEKIRETVKEQKQNYDYIIVDCPSGTGKYFESIVRRGACVIIVATPDLTSIRDAEKTADKAVENGVKDTKLIINRLRPSLIKKGLAPDIDEIIDSVSVQLLGVIPEDRNIITSANRGVCFADIKRSPAKKAIQNIAERIKGNEVPLCNFKK